jgi:zinc transporter ZupT
MAENPNWVKWTFIVVIFCITLGAGLMPMKIKSFNKNAKWVGVANTFSGGVFLAIAFVHILPETANMYYSEKLRNILINYDASRVTSVEKSEAVDSIIDSYQRQFPLPFVLVVIGYAFILLIDRVIIDAHSSGPHADCELEHVERALSDSIDK